MTQLSVGGVFLDLYNDEDIQITYAFDSFESYTPQSNYSKTFRVPSTPKNNQFFQTAFEINGYDFDVTQKHSAIIYNDGDLFMRGEIRLVKIYNLGDGNRIDYELIFFSNVRDLFTSIGNKTLQDLNLSGLTHTQSMENVKKSWLAYPQSVGSLALLEGKVLYPLIDFGNTYDSNEAVQEISISQGSGSHITNGVLGTSSRIWANRFKPMVSVSYLLERIIKEAGFNTNNLMGILYGDPFRGLYLSAFGNEPTLYTPAQGNDVRVETSSIEYYSSSTNVIKFPNEIYDYNNIYNTTSFRYVAPSNSDYKFKVFLYTAPYLPQSTVGEVRYQIRKNGTTVYEQLIYDYNDFGSEYPIITYSPEITLTLNTNDYVDVRIQCLNGSDVAVETGYFEVVDLEGAQVTINPLLEKDYKQIDFLKDILTKFKFVLFFDDETNSLKLRQFNDFLKLTQNNYVDWTSKLDVSKDVEISPIFFDQPGTLNYVDKEDKDWLNDQNLIINKEVYGTLIVDANNDLLKGSKEIKTNIAPTLIREMLGTNSLTGGTSTEGRDGMIIPHIYSLEAGETKLLKKPIVPKSRLLYYNGLTDTGITGDTTNFWYWDQDGSNGGDDKFPLVSPYTIGPNRYSSSPSDQQELSIDLNWQVEDTYIEKGYVNPRLSMFDYYWNGYINILYNKWSRRVSAYFMLDPEDLKYFNFEKKIFVKGTYYYVEKIHSVIIGKRGSYKVDLIKLLDPRVPNGQYIPPTEYLVWNTTDVFFDVEETFWNG